MNASVDGEVDVSELERLGARLIGGGVGIFGWLEQPEESDDAEVPDDLVIDPHSASSKSRTSSSLQRMMTLVG